MFSKLKALVDSEKFRGVVLSIVQKTITRNLEFSLRSMIDDCTCHRKVASYHFMYRAKTGNSESGFTLTGNSEIFEFSENSGLLQYALWPAP